jgi:hypothetical protein
MAFLVPCKACGAEYALPEQVVVRPSEGSVVTLRCRNCSERIRIEGFELLADFAPENLSLKPPPVRSANPPAVVETPRPAIVETPRPPVVQAPTAEVDDDDPEPAAEPSQPPETPRASFDTLPGIALPTTNDGSDESDESDDDDDDDARPRGRAMPTAKRLRPQFMAESPPESDSAPVSDAPPSSGTPDLATLRAAATTFSHVEERGPDSTVQRFALQISSMTQSDASALLAPPPPPLMLTPDEAAPDSAMPVSVMPMSEEPENRVEKKKAPQTPSHRARAARAGEATERPVMRSARATPKRSASARPPPLPAPEAPKPSPAPKILAAVLAIGAVGYAVWRVQSTRGSSAATSEPVATVTAAPVATPPAAIETAPGPATPLDLAQANSAAPASPTSAAPLAHTGSTSTSTPTATRAETSPTSATAQSVAAPAAAPAASAAAPSSTEAAPAIAAPPIDTAALRAALEAAAAQAASCKKDGDPSGSAAARVTFVQSGRVTSAIISGPPFAGTTTGGCIAATLRRARIPAFSGETVTVSKTVTIP